MSQTQAPLAPMPPKARPKNANAALVLTDGTVFWGRGVGVEGVAIGEVCFNTSITGYQEIMTDPSYAGQIITFTFPHIGNTGTNAEDIETTKPAARGCILRADVTEPASWRAVEHFNNWMKASNLVGISGVDTRALTRHIRDNGAPGGVVIHLPKGQDIDLDTLKTMSKSFPGLEGMDLAKEVMCAAPYEWDEADWTMGEGYAKQENPTHHVVAVDFGAKRNILRCLAAAGCRVTVVPGNTSAEDILAYNPDGVFLSNGPGDPAATGEYAVPMIQKLIESGKPLFGICLGHQMTCLALGAKTYKMHMGHRGANHPVKDLTTETVEITSQNHGFVVDEETLPANATVTHRSLFDKTLEGIALTDKPVFTVQHHPEASPGPQDSHYMFKRFVEMIEKNK